MKKPKKPEPNIEQQIAHIEKYERNPVVRRIISQNSSFEREVEDFYNLSSWVTWNRTGAYRCFKYGKEDDQKKGTHPIDLIDILNGFKTDIRNGFWTESTEPFDSSRLDYEAVRKDYKRHYTFLTKAKTGTVRIGGLLIGSAGLGLTLYGAFLSHASNVSLCLAAGIGGLIGGFKMTEYEPKPKGTDHELDEYIKLHESAETADKFMNEHYRAHFINKAFVKDDKTYGMVK